MKILMFCNSPRRLNGGMESVFSGLSNSLIKNGCDVYTLYRDVEWRKVEGEYGPSWNISLEHPRTIYKLPRIGSSLKVVRDMLRLKHLISKIQPDVVNCHFASAYTLYFCALRVFSDYKLVVSVHGTDVKQGMNSLQRSARPWIFRAADHVTAVSSDLETRARECAGKPIQSSTIYNGIDFDYWSQEADNQERSSQDRAPVITNVGSLRRIKGQDVLLRAFSKLRSSGVSARLWLVGDGGRREQLENLSCELGIESDVRFHGWCSQEEVREILYQSTVFAFPSRSEGFGMAVLEAMATGTPVVASSVGGIPEIITSDNEGIIVPPENAELLAKKLKRILCCPKNREGLKNGAKKRAEEFRWSNTVKKYKRLFSNIY